MKKVLMPAYIHETGRRFLCDKGYGIVTAEYAMCVILALARHLIPLDRLMKDLEWNHREMYIGSELAGKTLAIVGLGQVGRLVAAKAIHGFGMHVLGYDGYADPARLDPGISLCGNIETLFREGDYVSLHAPVTDETRGMVNAGLLSLMKPTACLVNSARGQLIDEQALYDALKTGAIRAAATDAYHEEPLVRRVPLLGLDNLITTPHIAFQTEEAMAKMSLQAAQGIDDALRGLRPSWPVNSPHGKG